MLDKKKQKFLSYQPSSHDSFTKKKPIGMTGKNVLKIMIDEPRGRLASEIVEERGWKKVGDEGTLLEMCLNLMDKNPDKVS
jgi:Asp-tRNA(Asn)/Glu-tRNA(Gln) amidotransferase B subunit